jgi:hypothetical protein
VRCALTKALVAALSTAADELNREAVCLSIDMCAVLVSLARNQEEAMVRRLEPCGREAFLTRSRVGTGWRS